jgi:hypothetical protein
LRLQRLRMGRAQSAVPESILSLRVRASGSMRLCPRVTLPWVLSYIYGRVQSVVSAFQSRHVRQCRTRLHTAKDSGGFGLGPPLSFSHRVNPWSFR